MKKISFKEKKGFIIGVIECFQQLENAGSGVDQNGLRLMETLSEMLVMGSDTKLHMTNKVSADITPKGPVYWMVLLGWNISCNITLTMEEDQLKFIVKIVKENCYS